MHPPHRPLRHPCSPTREPQVAEPETKRFIELEIFREDLPSPELACSSHHALDVPLPQLRQILAHAAQLMP